MTWPVWTIEGKTFCQPCGREVRKVLMLHWYEWHCDYCAERGRQEAVDDEPTNPGHGLPICTAGDPGEIWYEDGDDGWVWFTRKGG